MAYDLRPFLAALDSNWYADDSALHALVKRYAAAPAAAADELGAWGGQCAGRLAELAEISAQPDNAPYLRHFDAWNRRVDDVVLPPSTHEALSLVEGEARLGAAHGDPIVFYSKAYLYIQNGEAGVGCSMACTDGLVRALEALGDRPVHAEIAADIRNSTAGRVRHGAQFVTEIQGGSDVPANVLRAVPDGDAFRLYGDKWFCSNINADYFLMTARPDGAPEGGRGVGLFVVPAHNDDGTRNGYFIDRLKDKLGTRELATAECRFDGALAYPVGPTDRGVANVVSYVLVTSRVACINVAAALLRRAERVVRAYADFRTAFGRPIAHYPLVRQAIEDISGARARTLATLLSLVDAWAPAMADPKAQSSLDFRFMVSLSKAVLTKQATGMLREAMMILAGNGIEERFTPLPRLFRDSVIMETWEGPHNVLYVQALRDMVRFQADPQAFVTRVAGPGHAELADRLGSLLSRADDPETTIPFVAWAEQLVAAHGERILAEVGCQG